MESTDAEKHPGKGPRKETEMKSHRKFWNLLCCAHHASCRFRNQHTTQRACPTGRNVTPAGEGRERVWSGSPSPGTTQTRPPPFILKPSDDDDDCLPQWPSDQHQGRQRAGKTKLTCVETDRGGRLDRCEDKSGE